MAEKHATTKQNPQAAETTVASPSSPSSSSRPPATMCAFQLSMPLPSASSKRQASPQAVRDWTSKMPPAKNIKLDNRDALGRPTQRCQECFQAKPTFLDHMDNFYYCQECWLNFYGELPGGGGCGRAGGDQMENRKTQPQVTRCPGEAPRNIAGALDHQGSSFLPQDAPRGHIAHSKIGWTSSGGGRASFKFKGTPFQTTAFAAGSQHAAEVIARACWMKFEQGYEKPDVIVFRNKCYAHLKSGHIGTSLQQDRHKDSHLGPGRDRDHQPQVQRQQQ